MRFDWYAATVREAPEEVLEVLASNLGGEVVSSTPRQGYTQGHQIKAKGSTVATVFSGGRNGHPHVYASGDDTDSLVPVVRGFWPDRHHVTRMDAAEDFDGPATWDRLYGLGVDLAMQLRLKVNQAGDWLRLEDGRTLYLGAPTSAVRVRLYEKGKQLRGLAIDGGQDISEDLCRLEVQVRPEGPSRLTAASCEPADAFGYADWSRELLKRVTGIDVERVHIRERRESDLERALEWMVFQYGEHLTARVAEVGSWANLGTDLEYRYKRLQARRDGTSQRG